MLARMGLPQQFAVGPWGAVCAIGSCARLVCPPDSCCLGLLLPSHHPPPLQQAAGVHFKPPGGGAGGGGKGGTNPGSEASGPAKAEQIQAVQGVWVRSGSCIAHHAHAQPHSARGPPPLASGRALFSELLHAAYRLWQACRMSQPTPTYRLLE